MLQYESKGKKGKRKKIRNIEWRFVLCSTEITAMTKQSEQYLSYDFKKSFTKSKPHSKVLRNCIKLLQLRIMCRTNYWKQKHLAKKYHLGQSESEWTRPPLQRNSESLNGAEHVKRTIWQISDRILSPRVLGSAPSTDIVIQGLTAWTCMTQPWRNSQLDAQTTARSMTKVDH